MSNLNILSYFIIIVIINASCNFFQKKDDFKRVPVAKVGERILYKDEIVHQIPKQILTEDSLKLADKLVKDWVKKELVITKAESEISMDQQEITRKVEDYRYALIVHEFEKIYIKSHLDLNVSYEEIEDYYNEWSVNFVLKQNIIKCLYTKVPKNATDLTQLRRNFRNYPNSQKSDIQDYCNQMALASSLDDSVWINFDELIINTPLMQLGNKTQFLQTTEYSETRDEEYLYLFRILDYKVSDQISPLDYIRDDIESIIINKRKLALKKELEKAIYDEALTANSFEIYHN